MRTNAKHSLSNVSLSTIFFFSLIQNFSIYIYFEFQRRTFLCRISAISLHRTAKRKRPRLAYCCAILDELENYARRQCTLLYETWKVEYIYLYVSRWIGMVFPVRYAFSRGTHGGLNMSPLVLSKTEPKCRIPYSIVAPLAHMRTLL